MTARIAAFELLSDWKNAITRPRLMQRDDLGFALMHRAKGGLGSGTTGDRQA